MHGSPGAHEIRHTCRTDHIFTFTPLLDMQDHCSGAKQTLDETLLRLGPLFPTQFPPRPGVQRTATAVVGRLAPRMRVEQNGLRLQRSEHTGVAARFGPVSVMDFG